MKSKDEPGIALRPQHGTGAITPVSEPPTGLPHVDAILKFWFEDGLAKGWPSKKLDPIWFGGGAELDALIAAAFGRQVNEAADGGLTSWEAEPLPRLALIVLLDQFTRNVFRGSAKAFEGDARSQRLVTDALAKAWDQQLPGSHA